MPSRPDPPPQLTASELRLLAKLEGRPLPRGPALEAALGVSAAAALRLVRKLRRAGLLAFAAVTRPAPGACACISYLQIDWSLTTSQTLEDGFRRDPAICLADRILAAADYRLVSSHADHRAANSWIRGLRDTPGVARLTTRFCATVCDRPRFAAARLAADEAQARRDRPISSRPK
jgi:hypothetical protein